MHCEKCKARIDSTLLKRDGILQVDANPATQKVKLYIDKEKLRIQEIRDVLEQIGFPPK
ncbi:MAG: heavy-metal-associated domain-containing protein [Promethearchaeota archaeon]